MTFLRLLRSIVLAVILSQAFALIVAGLVQTIARGEVGGLFAVLALPMTLAFFGLPALAWSLFVIVTVFYACRLLGRPRLAPAAVFAVGAAIAGYLFVVQPEPTGAMPGYDQAAWLFVAASLVTWAVYAFLRPELRRSSGAGEPRP